MRARISIALALLVSATTVLTAVPALAAGDADLAVALHAPATAYVGQTIDVGASLTNYGPSSAEAVTLTLTVVGPATLFPAAGCQSEGSTRLVCQIGTMSTNTALPPRQFQARASAAGTVTFTAEISSPTPDPVAANNTDTAVIEVVEGGPADLNVRASGPAAMTVGQSTNYFVQFGNNGPSDATSVTLSSSVSSNLEIYDFSYPGCIATTTTIHCEFPAVQAQTLGIVSVRIRAVAPGAATISAEIGSADNPDPNLANNTSSTSIPVTASADVRLSLTESADPVKSKRDLTLTATVTNSGPSPSTTTTLVEDLAYDGPQGATIVSVTPSQGSCTTAGPEVSCGLGTVAAGSTATVALTVRARGSGTLTSQARVSAAETDPDSTNNAATEATGVSTSGH